MDKEQQNSARDLAINYIAVLGERTKPTIPVFPPIELTHRLLPMISQLPQSLLHFLIGSDYYQLKLLLGEQAGYQLTFIYAENLGESDQFILEFGLNVILICTEDLNLIPQINIDLARLHRKNCVYWVDDEITDEFILNNMVSNNDEFFAFLIRYCSENHFLERFAKSMPLSVPLFAQDYTFRYFNPCNVNTDTLNSAVGNWGYRGAMITDNEREIIREKSTEATSMMFGTDRQDNLTEQLKSFAALQYASIQNVELRVPFSDQFHSPLVFAVPFTSVDVRKTFFKQLPLENNEKEIATILKYILSLEYTTNYCLTPEPERMVDLQTFNAAVRWVYSSRSNYLDLIGRLHASFRFSPYFRTPYIGRSINDALSFTGAKVNNRLTTGDGSSVIAVIEKVGEMISNQTLAAKSKEMLADLPIQIVAISDLPVEWIRIDGVPLGFTHDICRIPETPSGGQMMHFEIARFAPAWKIPKDIISKTLVVYGCRSDAFVEYQEKVDFISQRLGFKTVICRSINEFEKQVKSFKPELLIIDSHGDADMQTHQSYIYMGDDKVYPSDIAERHIHAKLVFLSACNTAPTYNDVNIIANAFFESGAFAVTSAYLPLDIRESSTLYIRLLHRLAEAANQQIHRNWLAFISHLLRTSFIMSPLLDDVVANSEVSDRSKGITDMTITSMTFQNRRSLYKKMMSGIGTEQGHYDYSGRIPHYLMYSTLGRADLIEFESFSPNRWGYDINTT